eukprot:CAMPEP_0115116952 /NCGR_PEP_ID=MMETSP0227-20121206/43595_1 /TAXON_ID=89957 /ORGANISM="Polarella glacialis, Strain CCMP 1383" /LENGTH=92 /DNA_ID=CAMNT_0002517915 /DNA_START=146 /DNA_END=420 /DNA_ORIENTATION=-
MDSFLRISRGRSIESFRSSRDPNRETRPRTPETLACVAGQCHTGDAAETFGFVSHEEGGDFGPCVERGGVRTCVSSIISSLGSAKEWQPLSL